LAFAGALVVLFTVLLGVFVLAVFVAIFNLANLLTIRPGAAPLRIRQFPAPAPGSESTGHGAWPSSIPPRPTSPICSPSGVGGRLDPARPGPRQSA
jgi:hypothetical protein